MILKIHEMVFIGLFLMPSFLKGDDPTTQYEIKNTQFINQVMSAAQMDLDALLRGFHTENISFKLVEVDRPNGYYFPVIHLEVKLPKKSQSQSVASEVFMRFKYDEGISTDAISGAIQAFALKNAFQYLHQNSKFATPQFKEVTSQLHSAIPYRNQVLKKAFAFKKAGFKSTEPDQISAVTYEWVLEQIAKRNKTATALETVAQYAGDGVHPSKTGGDPSVVKMETVNIRLPDKSIFPIDVLYHDYDSIDPDEIRKMSTREIQKHQQQVTAANFLKALDTELLFNPFLRRQLNFSVPSVWKNTFSDEVGEHELSAPSEIFLAEVTPPELRFKLNAKSENLSFIKQTGDNHFEFQGSQALFPGIVSGSRLDLNSIRERVKGLGWFRMPEVNPSVFYLVDPNSEKTISNLQTSVELWNSPTGIFLTGEATRVHKVERVDSKEDPGFEKYSMKELHGKFHKLCETALGKLARD